MKRGIKKAHEKGVRKRRMNKAYENRVPLGVPWGASGVPWGAQGDFLGFVKK